MPSTKTAVVYGTAPGGSCLDADKHGGNPFASALIDAARSDDETFGALLARQARLTSRRTHGVQRPEWEADDSVPSWRFRLAEGDRSESRVALVAVVSDYQGASRLSGAAHDERRVSALLASLGFSVCQGVLPTTAAFRSALDAFAATSRRADVGLIYCTGHGIMVDETTYLMPGDFEWSRPRTAQELSRDAFPVEAIASVCRARKVNAVFFAGCRTRVGRQSRPP